MIGALGALFVMYLISPIALLAALALEVACYAYFKKKALEQQWGDVNAGLWMKIARFSLLRMNERNISPRNWRPIILLFAKDINERIELVKLAAAFGQNRGIFSISKLLFANDECSETEKKNMKQQMMKEVNSHKLEAFCEVNTVQSINEGILNISKGHGIAGLKTNTIMFGWSHAREANINQLKNIRKLSRIKKNIVLAKFNDHQAWKTTSHERIDIWWSGRENNGDLMLILAYMLKLNPEWEDADIHIRAMVDDSIQREKLLKGIKKSLAEARIPASVHILMATEDQSFTQILHEHSSDADIVFMGLKVTERGREKEHIKKIEELADAAKITVFVQNNSLKETLPILLEQAGST
jgi:hypothetical protein